MSAVGQRLPSTILVVAVVAVFLTAGFTAAYVAVPSFQAQVQSAGQQIAAAGNGLVNLITGGASSSGLTLSVSLLGKDGVVHPYNGPLGGGLQVTVNNVNISAIQWTPSFTLVYTGTIQSGSCSITHAVSDNAGVSLTAPAGQTIQVPATIVSGSPVTFNTLSEPASALDTGSTGSFTFSIGATVTCTITFTDGHTQTPTSTGGATVSYNRPSVVSGIQSLQVNISPSTTTTTGSTGTGCVVVAGRQLC